MPLDVAPSVLFNELQALLIVENAVLNESQIVYKRALLWLNGLVELRRRQFLDSFAPRIKTRQIRGLLLLLMLVFLSLDISLSVFGSFRHSSET